MGGSECEWLVGVADGNVSQVCSTYRLGRLACWGSPWGILATRKKTMGTWEILAALESMVVQAWKVSRLGTPWTRMRMGSPGSMAWMAAAKMLVSSSAIDVETQRVTDRSSPKTVKTYLSRVGWDGAGLAAGSDGHGHVLSLGSLWCLPGWGLLGVLIQCQ